jgi:hypothetical protein
MDGNRQMERNVEGGGSTVERESSDKYVSVNRKTAET